MAKPPKGNSDHVYRGKDEGRVFGAGEAERVSFSEGSANDAISREMQPNPQTGAQYAKNRRQTQR